PLGMALAPSPIFYWVEQATLVKRTSLNGIFLAAALLTAACPAVAAGPDPSGCSGSDNATAPAEVPVQSGVEFRAAGLAPRWTLELAPGECLHFIDHDAATLISAVMPVSLSDVRSGGLLYGVHSATHELQVGIDRRSCPGPAEADA